MCDCKTEIEALLKTQLQENYPKATDIEASLSGYSIFFRKGDARLLPCMPIEATYNTTTKRGTVKPNKLKQTMQFNHCPFCGEKIGD
jgi:hypothetical protein